MQQKWWIDLFAAVNVTVGMIIFLSEQKQKFNQIFSPVYLRNIMYGT